MPDTSPIARGVEMLGETLELDLAAGETAYLRRSSLTLARGPFEMTTERIARQGISVYALFTGEVRWANRYTAGDGAVKLSATRDFHGEVLGLPVSPDAPVHLQPARYLGHCGNIGFRMRKSAKKEFWVLTEATGDGVVYIKIPGTHRIEELARDGDGDVVDTNYVAAVGGRFEANGKVFTSRRVLKSGELSNVRLKGDGWYILQSQNPGDATAGGGGIFSALTNLLPF